MAIEIYNPVYDHYIYFLHMDKKGKWKEDEMYQECVKEAGEHNTKGTTYFNSETGFILIVANKKDMPVLAHECLHATCTMLRRKGIVDIMSNSEEPFTYALEWLMREILAKA